jgi:hypothetical protein
LSILNAILGAAIFLYYDGESIIENGWWNEKVGRCTVKQSVDRLFQIKPALLVDAKSEGLNLGRPKEVIICS